MFNKIRKSFTRFGFPFLMGLSVTAAWATDHGTEEKKSMALYHQANADGDLETVQRLYQELVANQFERAKGNKQFQDLISPEMNFVYGEPYWSYNAQQLQDYASRLVTQLKPHMIDPASLVTDGHCLVVNNERVKVRQVQEFNRILPLMYLKKTLTQQGVQDLDTPRFFLVPKKDVPMGFTFRLPYVENVRDRLKQDTGFNYLGVESDSFTIYQEYIDGEGVVGDTSFFSYGHLDFNQKQIMTQKGTGKKILIDTKNDKNFYHPALNPSRDGFMNYWSLQAGRSLPQDKVSYEGWKMEAQKKMLWAKTRHFPHQLSSYTATVKFTDAMQLDPDFLGGSGHGDTLDDPYFGHLSMDLIRYFKLEKWSFIQETLKKNATEALDESRVSGAFPGQEGFISLTLNALSSTMGSTRVDAHDLRDILYMLVNRDALLSEKDMIAIIQLMAEKDDGLSCCPIPYAMGRDILHAKLQGGVPMTKAIASAIINHGDQALFDEMLPLIIQDQRTMEDLFLRRLRVKTKPSFKEHAYGAHVLKTLLHALNEPKEETISKIFDSLDFDLLAILCTKPSCLDDALLRVVSKVNEPTYVYKDPSNGQGHAMWDKLLALVLERQPSEQGVDRAMAECLKNQKQRIFPFLWQYRPQAMPMTKRALTQTEWHSTNNKILMENAIKLENMALLQALTQMTNTPVEAWPFYQAVSRGSESFLDLLISQGNITLPEQAVKDAIDAGNVFAVKALLQRYKSVTRDIFERALLGKNQEIFTLVCNGLGDQEILPSDDMKELFEKHGIALAHELLENNTHLGTCLEAAAWMAKNPDFASHSNPLGELGEKERDWYQLMQQLLEKNIPAGFMDHALHSALMNQKAMIVDMILAQNPEIGECAQKALGFLKESIYSKQIILDRARKAGLVRVMDLFV